MEKYNRAFIINGKDVAARLRAELKKEVVLLREKYSITPGLAVVLIGENPASKVYVRNKARGCEEVGITSIQHTLPEGASQSELLALIARLNGAKDVHGILVQLPLPKQIDPETVIEAIAPEKDVDGFHPYNMGRLMAGIPVLQPCTPYGVMKLLEAIDFKVDGKDAVIIGRSNIVGKPMAMMLLKKNATVTVCHSKTAYLPDKVRAADIVVAAIGREKFVKGDWIKEGAVVIDVGINRAKDGGLAGDVDFEEASLRAAYITPVPGGVGPMTITMLLANTVQAAKSQLIPLA
ncbi:MAG: bifunctional methylenetetrahydrofolate dehydrogenase/methenyltetrahydrofolate cyclohydrolase FolD [Deltaproteobacteria bacterium]|nr:bifunctional methylenetetrahydrofolate dehydrogenase/methenyltetrahydrofolate cyclohydrolase FolD [Deltaproteobacteria bacterium]